MTNHGCMAMTLKPKLNQPNESIQKSQERKNTSSSVKCEAFAHCFLLFAVAWCIMNSWHKVVWSIRNTILKLWSHSSETALWKTNHGFCILTTHQLTQQCLQVRFWTKTNRNHTSTTVFPGFGPRWLFPLPKTEDMDERKAFWYDWGNKINFEIGAVGYTKKSIWEVFRRLKTTLA